MDSAQSTSLVPMFSHRPPPPFVRRKRPKESAATSTACLVNDRLPERLLLDGSHTSSGSNASPSPSSSLSDRLDRLERAEAAFSSAPVQASPAGASESRKQVLLQRHSCIQKSRRAKILHLEEPHEGLLGLPDTVLMQVSLYLPSVQAVGRLACTCSRLRRFLVADADLLIQTPGAIVWHEHAERMYTQWAKEDLYMDVVVGTVVQWRTTLRKRVERGHRIADAQRRKERPVATSATATAPVSVAVSGHAGWSGGSKRSHRCYLCGGVAELTTAQRNVSIVVYSHCLECGESVIFSKDQGF